MDIRENRKKQTFSQPALAPNPPGDFVQGEDRLGIQRRIAREMSHQSQRDRGLVLRASMPLDVARFEWPLGIVCIDPGKAMNKNL
jgi:hypothetical protein